MGRISDVASEINWFQNQTGQTIEAVNFWHPSTFWTLTFCLRAFKNANVGHSHIPVVQEVAYFWRFSISRSEFRPPAQKKKRFRKGVLTIYIFIRHPFLHFVKRFILFDLKWRMSISQRYVTKEFPVLSILEGINVLCNDDVLQSTKSHKWGVKSNYKLIVQRRK